MRVLLILTEGMGDVVLGTSMIKPLYEDGEVVDLLVPEKFVSLIPKSFYYQGLYTYSSFGRRLTRVFRQFTLSRQFPRYDRILYPRWDHDWEGIKRLLKWIPAREVVYFAYSGASKEKFELEKRDPYGWGAKRTLIQDARLGHELSHYAHFLKEAGYHIPPTGLTPFIRTIPSDATSVVVCPFSRYRRREWPLRHFVELTEEMRTNDIIYLVPLDRIMQPGNAKVICPSTPAELAGYISNASVFIGVDSGPSAIASAFNIPSVIISCHHKGADDWNAQSIVRYGSFSSRHEVYRPEGPLSTECWASCISDVPHCITQVLPHAIYSKSQILKEFL